VPVNKELARLEHSAVKLTLTVGKDLVRSQYDELIGDYIKSAAIPGFRKGKVPREVLERKFGSALKDEALNKIFGKVITEVFDDESFPKNDKPLPYSTPRIDGDIPELDLEKDMVFSVVYDVLPTVSVGSWKALEVEIPDVTVDDEAIAQELENLRDRNAIVLDRDEQAAAAKNDVVTVNYSELDSEKNPIPGSERQDFVFTLGSGYNLYQFDDDIAGMKKGDTKDITKSFPADYPHKEMAGKTLTIRVSLTALKEKRLPDLDDELAQDVDEKYKTLADLKNSIRERLTKLLDARIREITISKILEKILETTPIDLPESMIRIELDSRFRNLARRFNIPPEELEKNLAKTGEDMEKIREGWRGDAEKSLKSRLIIETLMQDLKLEASDEEIEKEMETQAAGSGTSLEDINKYYEQENAREYLKEDLKERKLFDIFIAENKVKKGKKEKYLDLVSNNR
jgi:trigger factor